MSIVSSGVRCDVCGQYILPIIDDDTNPFTMPGVKGTLHCHSKCKVVFLDAVAAKDWRKLPEGPVRELFESQELQRVA